MLPIILRRLALSVPLLLIVSAITFLLESFVPGNPARTLLGLNATQEQYDALRTALHLDQPERWDLASTIASNSADPQRIAELEAYESRSVPVESRKPFLASEAAIRQNQRFVTQVLPQLDTWIRTH